MTSETTDSAVPDFINNPDAMVWAEEFAKRVRAGCDPTDTGWLVAWFANAMACGELNAPATRVEHARLLAVVLEGPVAPAHQPPGPTVKAGDRVRVVRRAGRSTVGVGLVGEVLVAGCDRSARLDGAPWWTIAVQLDEGPVVDATRWEMA